MIRKLNMTSGPLQENSFIVITLNPESNCTCRKKNHVLLRWSTSTLPEQHIHHWTYCFRCTDKFHKIHFIERKASWRMYMVRVGDSRGNKQPQDQTMYGQICGSICLMQQKRKQNKDGLSRNQSSTMPDNWEEYSLLSQTMKNSSSQSKPPVESWKFRCQ